MDFLSAQRLTASKELEPFRGCGIVRLIGVLNALRHQRNWNLKPTCWWIARIACAQRLTASKELEHDENGKRVIEDVCSTPYGIKGIGTPGLMNLQQAVVKVLNALRHQRNWNRRCGR